MFVSEWEAKSLEEFGKKIKLDPRFIGIIVFGSALQSEIHQDVDLAIISRNPPISDREKLDIILSAPAGFDVRFLEDFPLNIAKDVIQGELLFNTDYSAVFNTFRRIIHEWYLFQPAFDAYLEVSQYGF